MTVSKDGRTTSERKYRPIRRSVSRYGKIEKVLKELKEEGAEVISAMEISYRVKILQTHSVSRILRFTYGVEKGKVPGTYVFTGEEIRVDAG